MFLHLDLDSSLFPSIYHQEHCNLHRDSRSSVWKLRHNPWLKSI